MAVQEDREMHSPRALGLAMAYPYLPGANSQAFKGVTVLAGLMLSLGASGVVGQAMSGLSLMYSRSLRVGEYVKIGETQGTAVGLGMFAAKLHTGLGEEQRCTFLA